MNEKIENYNMYLEKAKGKLDSALTNLEHRQFDDAVSRSYYCVFHIISGLIYLKDTEFSSHNQTLGFFNKEFIKTGIFPKEFGKWIYKLFEFREIGDYVVTTNISEKDAKESYERASIILNSINDYIKKTYL